MDHTYSYEYGQRINDKEYINTCSDMYDSFKLMVDDDLFESILKWTIEYSGDPSTTTNEIKCVISVL